MQESATFYSQKPDVLLVTIADSYLAHTKDNAMTYVGNDPLTKQYFNINNRRERNGEVGENGIYSVIRTRIRKSRNCRIFPGYSIQEIN